MRARCRARVMNDDACDACKQGAAGNACVGRRGVYMEPRRVSPALNRGALQLARTPVAFTPYVSARNTAAMESKMTSLTLCFSTIAGSRNCTSGGGAGAGGAGGGPVSGKCRAAAAAAARGTDQQLKQVVNR